MFRRLALLLLVAPPALAQVVGEGAAPVPRGQIVAEARLAASSVGAAREIAGPEGLVQWGLGGGVEARGGLPGHLVSDLAPGGFGDPALGLKARLGRAAGWDLGVLVEVTLPLGSAARRGPASPLLMLIAERAAGAFTLNGQAEVAWDRGADRADVAAAATVFRPVAGPVGAFAEVVAGSSPDGLAALGLVGAAIELGPVLLDLHGGLGLSAAAPDAVVGVGVGVGL